jgi:thioredoxin 2
MHSAAGQPGPSGDSPVIVACPNCHTLVRVPAVRLQDNPACAKCKQAVITAKPVALDSASFATHTTRSDLPVLVDFWADWCGPCHAMSPILDRFASEWKTRVQVGKVNTDENQQLSAQFGIRSIPTLILFRGGREIARRSGVSDLSSLSRWVDGALT